MQEHLQLASGIRRSKLVGMHPYRRHNDICPDREKGSEWLKCRCPLWVYGIQNGHEIRRSLKTRNLTVAWKEIEKIEKSGSPAHLVSANEAIDSWLVSIEKLRPETKRKYIRIAKYLKNFLQSRGIGVLRGTVVTDIDAYLKRRAGKSSLTLRKELEVIQAIFAWAKERGLAEENPVRPSQMPEDKPAKEVIPYTSEEIIEMLVACDRIGNEAYERLRAKAAMLLMRYYALRLSDVATFRRDAVEGDFISLRARKNAADLLLPLYPDVRDALARLPIPEGCADSKYFFWTGTSDILSVKKGLWRTLHSAFVLSKVKDAHPHRFRHTLATEILIAGGSIEDVAEILGDSPAIVRKHYKRWCVAYQARITRIYESVHRTPTVQQNFQQSKLLKEKNNEWWPGTESHSTTHA